MVAFYFNASLGIDWRLSATETVANEGGRKNSLKRAQNGLE